MKHLLIVTGYSGGGKTHVLRIIEDAGYYCVDNLPAQMLKNFIGIIKEKDSIDKVAVVIDARGKEFMRGFDADLDALSRTHHVQILFIECSLNAVTRRFKESRLRHPLSLKGSIQEGYQTETKLLSALRQRAHLAIDTSHITVHTLKSLVRKFLYRGKKSRLEINLVSFGYKHGLPDDADVVIDVRFLINPYFVPDLKAKSGTNKKVQDFIFSEGESRRFLKKTKDYIEYLLKRYENEGKSYVTLAVGCTGGKHRSVAVAERLRSELSRSNNHALKVFHRDVGLE